METPTGGMNIRTPFSDGGKVALFPTASQSASSYRSPNRFLAWKQRKMAKIGRL
jgi:hypothetical protein